MKHFPALIPSDIDFSEQGSQIGLYSLKGTMMCYLLLVAFVVGLDLPYEARKARHAN